MSLLFEVVCATACSGTHHKLAMDALTRLRGADSGLWRDVFLKFYEPYLEGSKAPDKKFKDFKNHVLHVEEGFWGGAVAAARIWYDRTVAALRQQSWGDAAYAAGVLSHYYTDPLMPFHTGQTEAEGKVHRAAEWSIACAYDELRGLIEQRLRYPEVEMPEGLDWLGTMVEAGATFSHPHYQVIIDHYDLARGVRNPPSGLDDEIRERIARCLAYATAGFARILERAIAESGVRPPHVELSLETFLATLKIPIRWVTKKMADADERALVERIYDEVQRTGKVVKNLPEDDRQVRQLHAEEVLQIPLRELDAQPAGPTGQQHGKKEPRTAALPKTMPSPLPAQRESPVTPAPRTASSPVVAKKTPRNVAEAACVREKPGDAPTPAASATMPNTLAPIASKPAPVVSAPSWPNVAPPARVEPRSTIPLDASARNVVEVPEDASPKSEPIESSRRERRFYLDLESELADAPSIGPKTAARFRVLGAKTVADFLKLDPTSASEKLGVKWLTAAMIEEMQTQSALMWRVPELRGHDVQILVACGVTEPAALASLSPKELMNRIDPFLETSAGARILRSGEKPDIEEVTHWIECAKQARTARAA